MALAALALLAGALPARGAARDAEALRQQLATCAACHGATGNSTRPELPSLAGQPKQFITTQLVMFREGMRNNPAMAALVAGMSNADIDALGGYFADQTPVAAGSAPTGERALAGRQLVERLNCVQCHGQALKGQQHIPRLAGQQAEYLRQQLQGFKAATRFDMDGNMTSAARALTAADINTLADYLSGLPN